MMTDTLAVATPNTVAGVFRPMSGYSDNLRGRHEPPLLSPHSDDSAPDHILAGRMLQEVRMAGRTRLTAIEIEQLLAFYGIPTAEIYSVTNLEQRGDEPIGEVGQPRCSTQREAAVDGCYELIVGSHVDPQCGPVLSFCAGGPLAEVFQERALALPPLTVTLARRMVERTRISAALAGSDGSTLVDLAALDQLLVRVSQLIAEQRWIKELVLTVLLVRAAGLLVRDAQVVVYDSAAQAEELPALAIHPYPAQYVTPWTIKGGTPVTIRPIRPDDQPLMLRFHETLSEQTVELRYFGPQKLSQRIAPDQLLRTCCIDYSREMVLVAEQHDRTDDQGVILGIGCLIKLYRSNAAEVALLVGDASQSQGIGSELLRRLIQIGRNEGVARIVGDVLPDNQVMLRILPHFGFQLHRTIAGPVRVALDL
jgi:acetyltransferase